MKTMNGRRKIAAVALTCFATFQMTGCASFYSASDGSSSAAQVSSASSAATSSFSESASSASKSPPSSHSSASSSSQTTAQKGQSPEKVPETEESQNAEILSIQKETTASNGYSAVTQSGGYQALTTDAERNLYKLIGNAVYQVAASKTDQGYASTGQITTPGKLTEAQIRITTTAYLDDHPQVFWISNAYSYGYQNSQTVLQLYSILSQSECNAAVLEFNGKLNSILQSIPSGLSEFDREEYLFHYITQNCIYDDSAVTENNWASYTAYGALVKGKAVCEGYSRAMLLLSGYTGLSSILIRGTGDGAAHMWNGINIDGNWYHIDLTWCDSSNLIYNYFNVDDTTIKLTHVIAPVFSTLTDDQVCSSDAVYNLTLPSCSSRKENYFQKNGIVISALDDSGDSAVISAIAAQIKTKQSTLAFRISSGDFDATVNGLVSAKPYKMSAYLQKAAAEAGVSLNLKKISYVTDKANSGLNVFVSYL